MFVPIHYRDTLLVLDDSQVFKQRLVNSMIQLTQLQIYLACSLRQVPRLPVRLRVVIQRVVSLCPDACTLGRDDWRLEGHRGFMKKVLAWLHFWLYCSHQRRRGGYFRRVRVVVERGGGRPVAVAVADHYEISEVVEAMLVHAGAEDLALLASNINGEARTLVKDIHDKKLYY